jgi:hypothetical protein
LFGEVDQQGAHPGAAVARRLFDKPAERSFGGGDERAATESGLGEDLDLGLEDGEESSSRIMWRSTSAMSRDPRADDGCFASHLDPIVPWPRSWELV